MSDVLAHWDEQAREHGAADTATAPDHFYRDLEIRCIVPYIRRNTVVLDVGCGNGYATRKFAFLYPSSTFLGVDNSEEMIAAALWENRTKNRRRNLKFAVGDVMHLVGKYETVISTRCLINLPNWESQQLALKNILNVLPSGGELILVENVVEGLDLLNEQRAKFGLPAIKQRWHNCYLGLHDIRRFLEKHFHIAAERNIGCLYYLISRVLYAKLAADDGEEPRYNHIINDIASQLPVLGSYGYSPNYLWHLRKK